MAAGKPDSRVRIMDATYEALIETGYADLTMNVIAAKSNTSTSLLYYHFNTKEDLLVAFLDHLIDGLTERFEGDDPIDQLFDILGLYILDPGEKEREAFHIAILELRSQAPYNERYRKRFQKADRLIRDGLATAITNGITHGTIHECDPETTARLLTATMDGARSRGIALGQPGYARDALYALHEQVLRPLFPESTEDRWHARFGE